MSGKIDVGAGSLYAETTWVEAAPHEYYPHVRREGAVVGFEAKAVAVVHIEPIGLGAVADGVALNEPGTPVLLTRQDRSADNGLWVTQVGRWTRP